jgi:hypothetical protein
MRKKTVMGFALGHPSGQTLNNLRDCL